MAFISSFALVTGDPVTFRMLGFGWLGIPLVRLIFTPFDSDHFYLEDFLWVFLDIVVAWSLLFG